jgi:hypothetical protein
MVKFMSHDWSTMIANQRADFLCAKLDCKGNFDFVEIADISSISEIEAIAENVAKVGSGRTAIENMIVGEDFQHLTESMVLVLNFVQLPGSILVVDRNSSLCCNG